MSALCAACAALGAVVTLGILLSVVCSRPRPQMVGAAVAAVAFIAAVFAMSFFVAKFINQQGQREQALRVEFAHVLASKYGATLPGGPGALPGFATRSDDVSLLVGGSEKLCDVVTKVNPVDVVVTCGVELPQVSR